MKTKLLLDIECYRNYFLVKFRRKDKSVYREYEMHEECRSLNTREIVSILRKYKVVTFNGIDYDIPMLMYALSGATCAQLKYASDWIIKGQNKGWQFEKQFGVKVPAFLDHIDLINVAFGQGSLKLYGGRLHSRRLQDLPIEPDALIAPGQRPLMRSYCGNDLDTTADLDTHLEPQIALREAMGASYGIDLRSKSDAQIAEAVLKKAIAKMLNVDRVPKPDVEPGSSFRYVPPPFIKFKTPELQQLLKDIRSADFVIGPKGAPIEPPALEGRTVKIGNSVYRLGIGGLHSSETRVAHFADEHTVLLDRDVASFYPAIVLICGLFPKHLTDAFLRVYRDIFKRRLSAKRSGNKALADMLKIVLNGTFGKLGSRFSALYAPDLMVQVTVTGQLVLLMLIEWLETVGIPVVSANTDGIVIKCPKARKGELDQIVRMWEQATGFETEETMYKALYSRDINNYIAIKEKGGTKGKGSFAEPSISKNPANAICNEAVSACLEHGIPIGHTILNCRDIRKFVTVRTVRGGAIRFERAIHQADLKPSQQRTFLLNNGWFEVVPGTLANARFSRSQVLNPAGAPPLKVSQAYDAHHRNDGPAQYIGKVVRYYKAAGEKGDLRYKEPNSGGNHNKVPGSDGARPIMEFTGGWNPGEMFDFPDDIDYDFYLAEANSILADIGAVHG